MIEKTELSKLTILFACGQFLPTYSGTKEALRILKDSEGF